MKNHRWVLSALCLLIAITSSSAFAAEPMKEWTFLTFLNGHNNLDRFGTINVNQMKQVGSTDQLNVVVQWASLARATTQRIYVKQGSYDIVQDLPRIDMGDYKQLVEFVRWGVENYPAKHYFINIWNHGGGWHQIFLKNAGVDNDFHVNDISWDDKSGHHITTEQLGQAMTEIAGIIGHKVDIYGSDACLMSMAEVAGEMADSVEVFAGSEETIPGAGWPYADFLRRWVAIPEGSSAEVATALSEEYLKSYSGGSNGRQNVTFSVLDLGKMPEFNRSVTAIANQLANLPVESVTQVKTVANSTENYTYGDYKDMGDFLNRLEANPSITLDNQSIADAKAALQSIVIANHVSSGFKDSHGLAVWIPTSSYDWNKYNTRYAGLRFDKETGWSNFLTRFFPK